MAPKLTRTPAAPGVPETAADPAVVAALAALSYDPVKLLGTQRADSKRWLVHRYKSCMFDGDAALDPADFARQVSRLAARWDPSGDDIGFSRMTEAEIEAIVRDGKRHPRDEMRLTALAAIPVEAGDAWRERDGMRRVLGFESHYGYGTVCSARYTWLVWHFFGGWDAVTQAEPRAGLVFWRGERLIAVMGGIDVKEEPAWTVGGFRLPPPPPTHDGALPAPTTPAPPTWLRMDEKRDLVGESVAWVDAAVRAIVEAAGGAAVDKYGFVLATRAGMVRMAVLPPKHGDPVEWEVRWGFEDQRLAELAGVKFEIGGGSLRVGYAMYAADVVEEVRATVADLQLPPGVRPPRALLLAHEDRETPARHRAAWRGDAWAVARVAGGAFQLLRGSYAWRERAAWAARRLNLSESLRVRAGA